MVAVDREARGRTPGPPPSPRRAPAARRAADWLRSDAGRTLFKYSIASVVATAVSQLTLLLLYGVFSAMNARDAAITATLTGAVPSYFLNRNWAWSRSGRSRLWGEVVPYVVTSVAGLVFSTWSSDVTAGHVARLSHSWRTALVSLAYLGSFGALWVAKFVLFNRLVFVARPAPGDR